MAAMDEPTTLGLSPGAHDALRRLKEEGYFGEMTDAFRFGVALALAHGGVAEQPAKKNTIFNVGTLDPDGSLYASVKALRESTQSLEPVYRTAERLAEWGVMELSRMSDQGDIDFVSLLEQAEAQLAD